MARFAPVAVSSPPPVPKKYQHGYAFSTKDYVHITKPGLTTRIVEEISQIKQEPDWMRQKRLVALQIFTGKTLPGWGADLSGINFSDIRYYLRPVDQIATDWNQVPKDVKTTFDRLKIPEAERAVLAGVKAQYDSEVVYGSLQKTLQKKGVIFLSMDEAIKLHPDLVKQYFGTIIPPDDNTFAALNSAVWSGGSFVYVPPGVQVDLPLQTYFRINSEKAGQFERTLIIVDEGASVHYVEGCFLAGTPVTTDGGIKLIETITTKDKLLSHLGILRKIKNTQKRQYTGQMFTITPRGNPNQPIQVTREHPFLAVRRQRSNQRNSKWIPEWIPANQLMKGDYLCLPINRKVDTKKTIIFDVKVGDHGKWRIEKIAVKMSPEFFRLIGYYLAEGSISSGSYLHFSFGSHERELIDDVKTLLVEVFGSVPISESHHKKNHGTSVVVSSVRLSRIFQQFGTQAHAKQIPGWAMQVSVELQKELILGWFRGDGNYYRRQHLYGLKEIFRINTVSQTLAYQGREILARLNIASSINARLRASENRQTMFSLMVGGEYLLLFGQIVGRSIEPKLHHKKRATFYHVDEKYLYAPVSSIVSRQVKNISVYNFSVDQDESYVVAGVAVHNCTAPKFSSASLHSAVVEIVVKKGARCQYTTVQNWYKNVYNLVTKRTRVEAEGTMIWTDCNLGARVTMKYPSCILAGEGARGETLSIALAGSGQHQDTGAKMIHLAPHTSSSVVSKSISVDGGRTSYRGLTYVSPGAHHSQNSVVCDALLLDSQSRSDTYPTEKVFNSQVALSHEATVSKIGDDQLFYLMSRGVDEESARKMIVRGFVADIVKSLPIEYAVEMNRLIEFEMTGSIG